MRRTFPSSQAVSDCPVSTPMSLPVLLFKPKYIYRLGHPENCYFHYLKKSSLDQSIQKIFYFILKTEALVTRSFVQKSLAWPDVVALKQAQVGGNRLPNRDSMRY